MLPSAPSRGPSRTEEVEISALSARLLIAAGTLLLAVACAAPPPGPGATAHYGQTPSASDTASLAEADPSDSRVPLRDAAARAGMGADAAASVPVHLYADESIRAQAGWKRRLRSALRFAANELSGPLGVRLVVASVSGFDTAGVSADLDAIHAAFTRATATPPGPGILVAFTGRLLPEDRSEAKWGLAEFLGRRLTVRLPPGEARSRALTHEILHLYGAMHVSDSIESLMNPSGDSRTLDSLSRRTVYAMRSRSFESGRLERDVLPRVDLREVIDAYVDALGANLACRGLGIDGVLEGRRSSHDADTASVPHPGGRDSDLADVTMKVAALMLSDGRRLEAVSLFETASRLYGPRTQRGTAAAEYAEDLRRAMRAAPDP